MQIPDRARFPNLALLRASAGDFGLDAVRPCLNAILNAALSFGSDAEGGSFKDIYLLYGQGDRTVSVLVTDTEADGYQLVVESMEQGEQRAYVGGLLACARADSWDVETVQLLGGKATASDFFGSIAGLDSLVLIAKEVGERTVDEVV